MCAVPQAGLSWVRGSVGIPIAPSPMLSLFLSALHRVPAQDAHVGTCQLAAKLLPAVPVHTQLDVKQPQWLSQTVHPSPAGLQGPSQLVAQHPGCSHCSLLRFLFILLLANCRG